MKLLDSIYVFFTVIVLGTFSCVSVLAEEVQPKTEQVIKIGLLVPENNSKEARFAAQIAIDEANKKIVSASYSFQLLTRSMEGPWGTGSKQAVDLIFNEKVWALLGSHDGRNAHLVEQVAAKTQVPFVSAWSGDPTLSQAFVPWYFSCVPNNNQQTKLLINEIYRVREMRNIITISDGEYDAEMALKSFLNKLDEESLEHPKQLLYKKQDFDVVQLVDEIRNNAGDGIVLFGNSIASVKIIEALKRANLKQPVFGILSVIDENQKEPFHWSDYEGVVVVNPGNWLNQKGDPFSIIFENKHGWKPGAVGAYAFDGMNVILEAVINSGFNLKKIKQTLADTKFNGVTGFISFDKFGNRMGANGLVIIKDGTPQTIKN